MLDTTEWAKAMFGHCKLGDVRRTRRLVAMARRLASQVGATIAQCCQGDRAAQLGSYRLVRNDRVEPEAIAEAGFSSVANEARHASLLLAVEDTTTLSNSHETSRELGPVGNRPDSSVGGYLAHSVLLLVATRKATVGLIDQALWARDGAAHGRKHQRNQRTYQAKESVKWQQASERVQQRLGSAMARTISICDRESDVYNIWPINSASSNVLWYASAGIDRRQRANSCLTRWMRTRRV